MTRPALQRLAVLVEPDRYELLEVEDLYFIEAEAHDCRVRTRRKRERRSTERLADLEKRLAGTPVLRVHRSFLVNLERVRELRRREGARGWELKLDPPVNAVIPVGRSHLAALKRRLGLS